MDFYCPKCGKALKKGETCDCDATEKRYIQPNRRRKKTDSRLVKILESFYSILTSPIDAGRQFVLKTDMIANIIFMLLQAIVSGVFAFIISEKKNALIISKYKDVISELDDSGIEFSNSIHIEAEKNFFMTIAFSLLLTLALAVVLYLVLKALKLNLNFDNIVSIIVIKTVPVTVLDMVACASVTFSSTVGWIVFILSSIVGLIYSISVYNSVVAINDNKRVLIYVLAFSIYFVLFVIFVINVAQYYVPDGLEYYLEYVLQNLFFLK